MLRSDDRILTTHVGSLPRNAVLTDLLIRDEDGEKAIDGRAQAAERERGALRRREAGGERRRHRERRRAAAGRLPDLRGAAHAGLRRRVQAAAAARLYGLPHAARAAAPPLSPARQGVECAAGDRRGPLRGSRPRRGRVPHVPRGARQAAVAAARHVHDGGLARHHRHDDAERPLRQPRSLCLRAGPPDAQGIRADRARLHPADRCARPGVGARHAVPGQERRRVRQDRRDAHRRAERGAWPAFRASASACIAAGATTTGRTSTTCRWPTSCRC